jgi:hypothetical protein
MKIRYAAFFFFTRVNNKKMNLFLLKLTPQNSVIL